MKSSIIVLALLCEHVHLLNNGLARRPPMGWMSWGYYMCSVDCDANPHKCLNEDLILSVVDTFYDEGYQDAGFEYIIIDDCWSEKTRSDDGRLVPDKRRFPRGMKYIADYIHARGLKFGMYTNVADTTCMRYPGSKGHLKIDAETFADWGVDYLKVDGCFVGEDDLNTAYINLGGYLNATGRPILYSCSWPYYIEFIHHKTPDYSVISEHCNMWRNYHDVSSSWRAVTAIVTHYRRRYTELQPHHGPGHWHDPDMLIFGHGKLTNGQNRVHLAVYAMLSAPLLLSCDMKKITPYEKELLLNLNLIAVAQDPMGVMARPYELSNSVTLWVKPHLPSKGDQYPSFSFAIVNLSEKETTVSFAPVDYGINSTDIYVYMDVFTQTFIKNITLQDTIKVTVPSEDVILYTLYAL